MNLQLYYLLFANFTMRFIPLILAAATATLFNVYAYAKPVMVSSLDSAVPLQLEDAGPSVGTLKSSHNFEGS